MYTEFLTLGLKAVKQAEELILPYYYGTLEKNTTIKQSVDTSDKHHLSPVTIADFKAEQRIRETLHTAYPDHSIIGEEQDNIITESEFTWIIDPIDGTKEFIRGTKNRGTLLALQHNNEIVLGISHLPLLEETAFASKGNGAFINGKRVQVSTRSTLQKAYICHERDRYFIRDGTEKPLKELQKTVQMYATKRIYDYHNFVSGKIDGFLGAGTYLFDIAPFVILTHEAGGKATTLQNKPITEDYTTYCFSNGLLHEEFTQYFID